jgi:hypothetical protein
VVQGAEREKGIYTNGICFTLEVTEHFIHQLSEVDWLTKAWDSRCAEVSKIWPPLFVTVTLMKAANGHTSESELKHPCRSSGL